jgi:SAM-dependent methyltransferase
MDGGVDFDVSALDDAKAQDIALPDYLVNTYTWAYLTPASLFLLDNPLVLTLILWGNLPRLVRFACAETGPGQRILQAANVYGHLSVELAATVGESGRLDVIDIAPIQVEHCRRKLAGFPHARVRRADAANPGGGLYDVVFCFFLLHEVPDDKKRAVVDGLMGAVRPGGKIVFVDYHRTVPWHPLRGLMRLVFRTLEPFAFGLIDGEIRDFASDAAAFSWSKETYFGGLYQKVVAVRESDRPNWER